MVNYVMRDLDKENDVLFTKFIRGDKHDEESIVRQYQQNENHNRQILRSNSNRMYMDILSFAKEDTPVLSNETLTKIGRKYVQLRGKKAISLCCVHRDKSHIHLHILLSAIDFKTGINNRLSREDFKSVKLEMEQYQLQFPEIQHSSIEHEKVKKKRR